MATRLHLKEYKHRVTLSKALLHIINYYKPNRLVPNLHSFSFVAVDDNRILNILKCIKSKAFGVDQINVVTYMYVANV